MYISTYIYIYIYIYKEKDMYKQAKAINWPAACIGKQGKCDVANSRPCGLGGMSSPHTYPIPWCQARHPQ